MESTLHHSAFVSAKAAAKTETILYRALTALFCLQIGFTAYAQLQLPQVAAMFTHLGFPDYFRVELTLGQVHRRGRAADASAGTAQGVGTRRIRHHARVGADCPLRPWRRRRGVDLGGRHSRAVGALLHPLAPAAVSVGERRTAHHRPLKPLACETTVCRR